MAEFKVGDKVRCVDNTHLESHLTVGKIYIVLSISYSCGKYYLRMKPDNELDEVVVASSRFKLVEYNPVLTPEEVFEHLRKGTKLQLQNSHSLRWYDVIAPEYASYEEITSKHWRIKPEPEVIELNGKRYKLIEE